MMGRAARNVNGRVILYADTVTGSIKEAKDEVERRRKIQEAYNKKHNITPKSAGSKMIASLYEDNLENEFEAQDFSEEIILPSSKEETQKLIETLKAKMFKFAKEENFEEAIKLRDKISKIENMML